MPRNTHATSGIVRVGDWLCGTRSASSARTKDVIELGCGTAYFSAWLARRDARPVGVDITPAQLRAARQCQRQTGIIFPLIEADAADVPLPGASFDLVISECGASLWCDPARR